LGGLWNVTGVTRTSERWWPTLRLPVDLPSQVPERLVVKRRAGILPEPTGAAAVWACADGVSVLHAGQSTWMNWCAAAIACSGPGLDLVEEIIQQLNHLADLDRKRLSSWLATRYWSREQGMGRVLGNPRGNEMLMLRLFCFGALLALSSSIGPRIAVGGTSFDSGTKIMPTCASLVGANLYSCAGTNEVTGTFHDCYQAAPGSGGEQFDLTSATAFGPLLACDCNPTGTAKKPRFDASPHAFTCNGLTANSPTAFVGRVVAKGNRIVRGVLQIGPGFSSVLTCVLDPTCTP
jgi:hypothetical protein